MANYKANRLLLDTVTFIKNILSDATVKATVLKTILSDGKIIIDRLTKTILSDTKIVKRYTPTILVDTKVRGTSQIPILSDSKVLIPIEYATDIQYYADKLFISCDVTPVKFCVIDISGGNIFPDGYKLDNLGETYINAKTIGINTTFNKFYLGCESGKIAKIDMANPEIREELNVSDSDTITSLASFDNYDKIFAATNNSIFEYYILDNSLVSQIKTDLRFIKQTIKNFRTKLSYTFKNILQTDLRFLTQIKSSISTDFRYNIVPYEKVSGITADDIEVFINSSLSTDIVQSSLRIMLNADEDSQVQFILSRKHDRIDYTLDGVYNQISNNNEIDIYINSIHIFNGKVTNIDCSGSEEQVTVTAIGEEYTHNTNVVTLNLPGLNEKLHLYHVLMDNISIKNPYIAPDAENPLYYKGVRIDKGIQEIESQEREDASIPWYSLEEIVPDQNYTYFWNVSGLNFITGESFQGLIGKYIGTSLSPVSSDTFLIDGVGYWKQRIKPNIKNTLGYYTVGQEPFKEISTKNGEYIAWDRWEDKADGLYIVLNPHYHYVNWAKAVANVEYQKLQTINGTILPRTSVSLSITIDAFLYYNLQLLQRINIGNTTQTSIYQNNNGFPLSIKSIIIDCSSMKVDINADNEWSQSELDDIDKTLPTEPEELPGHSVLIKKKYDLSVQDYID